MVEETASYIVAAAAQALPAFENGGAADNTLGWPYALGFAVIIAAGVYAIVKIFVEALNKKRPHLAGVFLSVGGTALAYEILLFARAMLAN